MVDASSRSFKKWATVRQLISFENNDKLQDFRRKIIRKRYPFNTFDSCYRQAETAHLQIILVGLFLESLPV